MLSTRESLNRGFIKMRVKWFSLVRITGLLLVLLYHFFQKAFPGGFIGVDIFFTFSGFLITSLLIDEFARDKDIDVKGFLRRRFYRIVPPVVLMVLVTMPATACLYDFDCHALYPVDSEGFCGWYWDANRCCARLCDKFL